MVEYIKSELIGVVSPGHLNSFSYLFICTTLISTYYVLLLFTVPMYTMLPTSKYQNITYPVAVVSEPMLGQLQFP